MPGEGEMKRESAEKLEAAAKLAGALGRPNTAARLEDELRREQQLAAQAEAVRLRAAQFVLRQAAEKAAGHRIGAPDAAEQARRRAAVLAAANAAA